MCKIRAHCQISGRKFSKQFFCAAALGSVMFAGLPGRAATIIWTNTAGGSFGTAANWVPNQVPGANDLAVINPTNAGLVVIMLDTSRTVGSITLGTNTGGPVTLSLNNQPLALNGLLKVNPSGSFTVDSGSLTGNTNAVLTGTIGWSAGTLAGTLTLAAGSTFNITTGNNHDFPGCVFTNNGTVAWNNGNVRGGSGGLVVNNGLFDCQSDMQFNDDFGGAGTTFNNYGTLRKSGGASEFSSATVFTGGVFFNQLAGMIDVQNGTNGLELAFQGGGNLTGGYITTNQFGLTVLSAGNFNLNGTVTGTNTWEDSANLTGTNNVIQGALTWVAGNWNPSYFVTIAANSTLLIAGGTANMDFNGVLVTNNGTVKWSSGTLRSGNGGTFYNYGLFDCQTDQTLNNDYGGAGTTLNNYGTFRKSAGTNTSQTLIQSGVLFNQLAGAVDVRQGYLTLQGGGNFTGGAATNNNGVLYFSSGNFNLNGTLTGTNVIENAGNLVGNNVIQGTLQWQAGSWQNASSVTVSNTSTVNIAGGTGNMFMYNLSVTNYGTIAWVSGYPDGGGTPATLVYNYGLWDCQGDYNFKDDAGGAGTTLNNYGTFRKSAGTNTSQTLIQNGVFLNNFGKVDAQAGVLTLQGGINFTNGTVNLGISGLTNYGKLNVPSAVVLSGTISANLNNGYVPFNGNSFTNLYYTSFTGGFTNTLLPFADAWVTNYFPTYYVMTVLNARPVFAALPTNNIVVNELTSLNVTNTSTDLNIPVETLTYSLLSGVPDMTVNSANGIFSWTPPQTNSPSTNTVSVAVVNNGVPPLSATNTFTVIVKEVNVPPTMPTIATQTVSELTLLTVTNAASESNIHSTTTGYILVNPIAGMSISAGGVITWTPTQLQSPGTNLITTIVTNSNPYDSTNPTLTSTNRFTVIVREVNVPPSPLTVPTQIVNELALLTVTNSATNANIHSTIAGYALVNPLVGMGITAGGIFTWTPAQTQSPSTNLVTTIVTNSNPYDSVNPKLTATNTFTVIVKEVNQAPTLGVIGTQTLTLLQPFSITNSAGEPNIHSANAGYLLVSPPAGASITASGVITWTPTPSQTLTTNTITTIVTNSNPYDLVNPHLSATNSFLALVVPNTNRIAIAMTNGILSWPADHTGWRLQNQTNTLAKGLSTNWTTVVGSTATNSAAISIARTNGMVLFRLVYP